MRALGTKSTAGSYAMCSGQLLFFRNVGTQCSGPLLQGSGPLFDFEKGSGQLWVGRYGWTIYTWYNND